MDELFNAGVLILIFCKIKLGLRKKQLKIIFIKNKLFFFNFKVEKAHGKKAAALPNVNSGHPKKPVVAHPAVPKNAQAKPGHLNGKL